MKLRKTAGIICFALAALLAFVGILGHIWASDKDTGIYGATAEKRLSYNSARTASSKTAPSAIKKVSAAQKAAEEAVSEAEKAAGAISALIDSYEKGETGLSQTDVSLNVAAALSESEGQSENAALLTESAYEYVLGKIDSQYSAAAKSLSSAISKYNTAVSGIADVYKAIGSGFSADVSDFNALSGLNTFVEYSEAMTTVSSKCADMKEACDSLMPFAEQAQTDADTACETMKLPLRERLIYLVGSQPIGFIFTAALFLCIGLCFTVFSRGFVRLWKSKPVFSTLIALIILLVIQVYALGFSYASYGEWGLYWLKNLLNVMRSNSSVGMIALGMTFVIISGGIDLAVGSNLAGIATIVMVVLDTSANGYFTGIGITGVPSYILAIVFGLLAAGLLGVLTGLGITKGRIPPFILTLGIMNIVRSVAQYFTKSYKPEVPKAFQVIANKEIIGDQMLLPIIYWLVLAVIMYIIANHTAFGRHVYAVGSNEKASRLSGINVDRVKIGIYVIMGIIVAIAAITSVARLRGVDVASAGSGYEMNAIAAVVVGGTSMSGGKGSILGTVFGTLMIGIMSNLLVLVGIDAFLSNAFTGAIIVFAVLIQRKDQ